MLRIPGSINSKNGEKVRIIQKWNGYRPNIKLLLKDFYIYLSSQRLGELEEKISRKFTSKSSRAALCSIPNSTIPWIENLLQTPISDYRKLAIWHILAPYLLNIRGLSPDEVHGIVREWLDKCSQLRRLDFNPSYRIKSVLNNSKGFLPTSCEKLKTENQGFYNLLQENGVLR
jgi:hypothetical protein